MGKAFSHLEGIILDWAGTILDYGCLAPTNHFKEVFRNSGVNISEEEARSSVGSLKKDHLEHIFKIPRVHDEWLRIHGKEANQHDIDFMYSQFEHSLAKSLMERSTPIEGAKEFIDEIKAAGLKIGSSTGYPKEMLECIVEYAKKSGIELDAWVSPDMVSDYDRPYPFMIFKNMELLGLEDVRRVVKVGDTCADIKEAHNAGMIAIAKLDGSAELGFSEKSYGLADSWQKEEAYTRARDVFESCYADYIVKDFKELLDVLYQIDEQLS